MMANMDNARADQPGLTKNIETVNATAASDVSNSKAALN
jgi:hypothetical protein